jgi:hypothetical protein
LIPLGKRLDVDGANPPMAGALQIGHKVSTDESAGAGDHDEVVSH